MCGGGSGGGGSRQLRTRVSNTNDAMQGRTAGTEQAQPARKETPMLSQGMGGVTFPFILSQGAWVWGTQRSTHPKEVPD